MRYHHYTVSRRRRNRSGQRRHAAPLRIHFHPWMVWAAFVATVVAGVVWSPITAVRAVRVVGARPEDRAAIKSALQLLSGVPCAVVPVRRVESLVQSSDGVRKATLARNPFGSALLRVEPHVPVARLDPRRPIYLSREGTVFTMRASAGRLPLVRAPMVAQNANLTLVGAWQPLQVADLCARVPRDLTARRLLIEVDRRGVVTLRPEGMCRIILGSPTDLLRKLERLGEIMKTRPAFLATIKELNLTAPDNPVYVP